jgi:hypothetical protein
MYNNYATHRFERPLVEVRYIYTDANTKVEREEILRFNALNFGCRCASYLDGQGQSCILEMVMGAPDDATSAFRWCEVRLNLPCSERYDPSLPRVLTLMEDGELATCQATMVDDIWMGVQARNQLDARAPCRQLKAGMNSLGNQASDRK